MKRTPRPRDPIQLGKLIWITIIARHPERLDDSLSQ
jgi:hypothetical protein